MDTFERFYRYLVLKCVLDKSIHFDLVIFYIKANKSLVLNMSQIARLLFLGVHILIILIVTRRPTIPNNLGLLRLTS